jgi:hypothetical protein
LLALLAYRARVLRAGANGAPSTPGRLGYWGRKLLMVLVGLVEPGLSVL